MLRLLNKSKFSRSKYRLFVLSFENNAHRTRYTGYFLPKVEIKDYNVMINGQSFFDQPVKNDLRIYDNVQKITIGQGIYCSRFK